MENRIRPLLSGWVGGKSKLAKQIIQEIPTHKCYAEPFCGAAWVLFSKEESKVEVINDINKEIIGLYRVVQNHLDEFIRYFRWALISRDEFARLLQVKAETLTDIQRAARFYYLQQSSYGGKIDHTMSFGRSSSQAPRLNILRIEELLSQVHLRLARTYIECLNYADFIDKYDSPETFFYIDPPYWDCENYYGKNVFAKSDFTLLAEKLSKITAKFLLSLNDCNEVRDIFANYSIQTVSTSYSLSSDKHQKAQEIFIKNY